MWETKVGMRQLLRSGRDGFSGHPRVPASCSALLIQIAKGCHDFTKYFDNDEEMCDT
jgi:hypothetical protein